MANEKISGMSAAATLTGSELVEVVQSGDNVRTTTQAIADLATGSGVTGTGTTNKVAKIVTLEGADGSAIVTIGNSHAFENDSYFAVDFGYTADSIGTQIIAGTSGCGISVRDLTNAAGFDAGSVTANMQAGAAGNSPNSRLQVNLSDILVKSPNISNGTYAYFEDDGNGNFTMRSAAPPSGGITGVAPVGNVPKVATVDTGDVILTLEESSIDDLAAGLSVIKSAAGGQYVTLAATNTDDDIDVQLNLVSNNTATVYQANLYIADPNTASIIGLTQELDFIKLGFNAGGTDTVSLKMEFGTLYHKINNIDYLEMYTDTVYIGDRSQGAYLNIDSAGKLVSIGDALGVNNGNYISVDDAGDLITFNSTKISVNGTDAFSGTVAVPTSITVINGLVTACT